MTGVCVIEGFLKRGQLLEVDFSLNIFNTLCCGHVHFFLLNIMKNVFAFIFSAIFVSLICIAYQC